MDSSVTQPTTPLAIVGIGCLFPGADTPAGFWARVVNRFDAIREVPASHWRAEDYLNSDPKTPDHVYAARGGFLDPVAFNPTAFGIPPSNLEATDASQLLGLVVAQQALNDCGYSQSKTIDRGRVSVILGVTGTLQLVIPLGARLGHPLWKRALAEAGVDADTAKDVIDRIADGYVPWQENSFPGLLGNVVAGRIANRFDLGGTNCVVDAACASSLSAVHLAAMELTTGRADLVLTGGVDTFNDIFMFTCFSKTPALSPSGNAKPFDAAGDGTVLGEGLGMVVLKRLDDARRDGDTIYAILKGVGSSSDGKGGAIYAPRREGQVEALKAAYRVSGVSPDTIELVEGHGTGTKVGDATEVSALAEVYGGSGRKGCWAALGSIKSQIGHTKAAAGAAGLIKAALALHHKVLPPTIKVTSPLDVLRQPDCPLYVNTEKRPWLPSQEHPRRAAVSAFGFGGSNFHLVLEEASTEKTSVDWASDVQILAFSADDARALKAKVSAFPVSLPWPELHAHADRSRKAFSVDAPCRAVLVARREGDIAALLQKAIQAIDAGTSSDNIFIGQGRAAGKLAALFPGQGAQYAGMLRDLSCHFPPALATLAQVPDIADLVYPKPVFTPEDRSRQEEALRRTDVAQPAIGAVSLGAWRVLESFGVAADAFAGHSYGELVALCAAGRLAENEFFSLSRLRGRLMAEAGTGDAGAMLAVKADEAVIRGVLSEERLDLILANKNAPTQTVLSGATAEIARAEQAFAKRKVSAVKLSVSAAFHSPLVSAASGPFRDALASASLSPGRAVFANTTAAEYPQDADAARDLLAQQLARPVEWVSEIRAMHAAGVRTFVEVGPGARLSALVGAIAPDAAVTALDSSGKRDGFTDLASLLAFLAARGHAVELARWHPLASGVREERKPAHTVELSGVNYVKPRAPRPPRPRIESPPATNGTHQATMKPQPQPTADPDSLGRALDVTRESLAALQRMQEQTAQLHRQFLDGQDQAQRSVQTLLEQQQRLLQASLGQPVTPLAVPVSPPVARVEVPRPVARPVAPPAPVIPAAPAIVPVPILPTLPVAAAPPAVPAPASDKRVEGVLLEVIAEKTGYPTEMLELGMSLDSDLGIDSIKRVEILSALQERLPEAPAVKPEHLGTLHTLGDIAAFLAAPAGQAGPPPSDTARPPAPREAASPAFTSVLLEVIAEKTGYPTEMLELGMSLDSDLGIDSIKRVEILSALQERLPEAPAVKPEHLGTLHTLGDIAAFLAAPAGQAASPPPDAVRPPAPRQDKDTGKPPLPTEDVPHASIERSVVVAVPLTAARPAVRLPGATVCLCGEGDLADAVAARLTAQQLKPRRQRLTDDPPADLVALILLAPPTPDDAFLRDALFAVQKAGDALKRGGVLLTVSRLDGAFGLVGKCRREPIDGGLAGLAKTVRQEWPQAQSKALDVAPDLPAADAAALIAEELTLAGPAEVGLSAAGRVTLARHVEMLSASSELPFRPGEVVIVSGGARGVTAECAVELAKAYRPTLLLLGRSPAPGAADDLEAITDPAQLKQQLSRRHPGTSPRELGEMARALEASREMRATLSRISDAGGKAIYRSVDVADAAAVAQVVADIRRAHGPVRGVVHGAGVLADARIEDKTPAQFDSVYRTKVLGLRSLLAAVGQDDVKAIALFSSSTARFGRTGQVDYAIANEVLNKLVWQEACRRPNCRVVSLNWGPWDGGMVTPALKKLFTREGVGTIPLTEGAKLLVEELRLGSAGPREVVVLAAGSTTEEPAPTAAPSLPPALPVAFERVLSVAEYPVLRDHVLDGRAVLPTVLMLEWMAHAAVVQNPGLLFHGCDELRVLHGVTLNEGGSVTLRIGASKATRRDGLYFAPAELRSVRPDGREVLHARAEVVLASTLPAAPPSPQRPAFASHDLSADEAYRQRLLFHGPRLQAIERLEGCDEAGIAGLVRAAPAAADWQSQPLRPQWLTDPLALDGAMQLMILWTWHQHGAPSLPCYIRSYRQWRRSFPAGGARVIAQVTRSGERMALADVDFLDAGGALVARLESYESVIDPALEKAYRRVAPALSSRGAEL